MKTQSILCVEPDRELQMLLSEVLREFRPVFADNAYDALRELNSRLFDAYLMESRLPDFSGLALCREIHRTDPHGPVIFCTGAVRKEDRLLALQAGVNAYICKPFDPPELLRQLRVQLALAEIGSKRASAAAKAAIADELARRRAELLTHSGAVRQATLCALERICRTKAFTAYAQKAGTRANFERCWDRWFFDVVAEFDLGCTGGESPANQQPFHERRNTQKAGERWPEM
jgi:DNA-binding response OmpR family regulator